MYDQPCHAEATAAALAETATPLSGKAAARQLILKGLGVRRVADWCGVGEDAVYQWISRGTDETPIPERYVAPICRGAKADGLACEPRVLWPAMAGIEP
jgi:hypothetical protein